MNQHFPMPCNNYQSNKWFSFPSARHELSALNNSARKFVESFFSIMRDFIEKMCSALSHETLSGKTFLSFGTRQRMKSENFTSGKASRCKMLMTCVEYMRKFYATIFQAQQSFPHIMFRVKITYNQWSSTKSTKLKARKGIFIDWIIESSFRLPW